MGLITHNNDVQVVGNLSANDVFANNINVLLSVTASSLSGTHYGDGTQLEGVATKDFVNSNFLNLTGGTISGATRINNDLTIFGNLTATGTTTFANTIFSVTSSLSVVHVGSGPALWVGNNGDGDIASFYDIDTNVEILHVGGNNGSFPNVGVKTSTPNVDFTVNGQISANNTIWDANGNSNNWNSAYSSWNSASATSVVEFNDTRFAKLSSQAYIQSGTHIQPIQGGNTASGYYGYSNIGGGCGNTISGYGHSYIGGGADNIISDFFGQANYATVGGGRCNNSSEWATTVGGGQRNCAIGPYSTVAGGSTNSATYYYDTVAGGQSNTASGCWSNVAGGRCNTASGSISNVAGGGNNTASGNCSSILGGSSNNTNNQANTFILGSNITAPQANYTYVNNLSSQGLIAANGGNSNNWNSVFSTFNTQSANNLSVFSNVNSNSANWNSVFSSWNSVSALDLNARTWVTSNSANARFTTITTTSSISSSNTITANIFAVQSQVQYLSAGMIKVSQYYNPITNTLDTVFF